MIYCLFRNHQFADCMLAKRHILNDDDLSCTICILIRDALSNCFRAIKDICSMPFILLFVDAYCLDRICLHFLILLTTSLPVAASRTKRPVLTLSKKSCLVSALYAGFLFSLHHSRNSAFVVLVMLKA